MTPSSPTPAGPGGRPRRVDESMTLLTEMMQRPLDPSYAAEAQRRRAAGLPPARPTTWRVGAAALVLGLLFSVSARTLREPRDAVAAQKKDLVAQITAQQRAADALQTQDQHLRAEIDALQGTALQGASREDLTARLDAAQVQAGTVAVTGPGVVLTLDDAPRDAGQGTSGDPRDRGGQDMGVIVARDVQLVVNGLWQSGAEAVSVNGQRLTATSAIRFAGDAILVDYRPLARPYVITAVGDGASLDSAFARTEGGVYVQGLADQYGVVYSHQAKDSVTCPAGTVPTLRHARTGAAASAATGTAAATPTPTPTATTRSEPRP